MHQIYGFMLGTIQGPKSSLLTLQHGDAGGWYQINDLHIIGETFGQPSVYPYFITQEKKLLNY